MATRERIAEAVDNEKWQEFRVSLKGLSTEDKLKRLQGYYDIWNRWAEHLEDWTDQNAREFEDVCIRVDNYIKALCRGGQLYAGESLQTALDADWNLKIKR